jgi:large subunit ribosomal protein L4
MYRGAIASILSELLRQDRLQVIERFDVDAPKTSALVRALKDIGPGRTLVVSEEISDNLMMAARNLPDFAALNSAAIDPVSLVHADRVLVTVESMKKIQEWLG